MSLVDDCKPALMRIVLGCCIIFSLVQGCTGGDRPNYTSEKVEKLICFFIHGAGYVYQGEEEVTCFSALRNYLMQHFPQYHYYYMRTNAAAAIQQQVEDSLGYIQRKQLNKETPIALVGHSQGAVQAILLKDRLEKAGYRVDVVVSLAGAIAGVYALSLYKNNYTLYELLSRIVGLLCVSDYVATGVAGYVMPWIGPDIYTMLKSFLKPLTGYLLPMCLPGCLTTLATTLFTKGQLLQRFLPPGLQDLVPGSLCLQQVKEIVAQNRTSYMVFIGGVVDPQTGVQAIRDHFIYPTCGPALSAWIQTIGLDSLATIIHTALTGDNNNKLHDGTIALSSQLAENIDMDSGLIERIQIESVLHDSFVDKSQALLESSALQREFSQFPQWVQRANAPGNG